MMSITPYFLSAKEAAMGQKIREVAQGGCSKERKAFEVKKCVVIKDRRGQGVGG